MKERFFQEINKIKSLKGAERREYIWEYYKLHFFVFVFIMMFVYMFLDALIFNPVKQTYLGFAIYGPFAEYEICMELQERFNDNMLTEEMRDTVSVVFTNFFMDPTAGEYYYASMERFYAMVSAREIDIIITNEDFLTVFAQSGSLLDLSFLDVDFSVDDMYHTYVYLNENTKTDSEYPFAIPLTGTSMLDVSYYAGSDYYLCVMQGTIRPFEVTDAINLILAS